MGQKPEGDLDKLGIMELYNGWREMLAARDWSPDAGEEYLQDRYMQDDPFVGPLEDSWHHMSEREYLCKTLEPSLREACGTEDGPKELGDIIRPRDLEYFSDPFSGGGLQPTERKHFLEELEKTFNALISRTPEECSSDMWNCSKIL